jgi:hypothetical protein
MVHGDLATHNAAIFWISSECILSCSGLGPSVGSRIACRHSRTKGMRFDDVVDWEYEMQENRIESTGRLLLMEITMDTRYRYSTISVTSNQILQVVEAAFASKKNETTADRIDSAYSSLFV